MRNFFQTMFAWRKSKTTLFCLLFLPLMASAVEPTQIAKSAFCAVNASHRLINDALATTASNICQHTITPVIPAKNSYTATILPIAKDHLAFEKKNTGKTLLESLHVARLATHLPPPPILEIESTVTAAMQQAMRKKFVAEFEVALKNKLHQVLVAELNDKSFVEDANSYLLITKKSKLALLDTQINILEPTFSDVPNPVLTDVVSALSQEATFPEKIATVEKPMSPPERKSFIIQPITMTMVPTAATVATTPQLKPMTAQPAAIGFPPSLDDATSLSKDLSSNEAPTLSVPEYVIIRPADRVTFSSETSASVLKINVKEGENFEANAELLILDCRVQQADLAKALAQQQATSMALSSAKKLKSYGSISSFEYTQALTQNEIASAEVDKLHAVVEKCTIRAPFKGSVADLMVHEFETVKPGDPLLKIVGTENLEFELQVPSLWLRWLHVDSIFYVRINELGETVKVRVTKINPQIDSISQTVRIVGKLDSINSKLLPGMSGQASFPDNPDNAKRKISTVKP